MTVDRISGTVFAIFAALVLWESSKIPFGTLADPGPGALPMLLAGTLLVCSLGVACIGRTSERLNTIEWPECRYAVAILGTLALMALAMEWLGYRITIFTGLFVLVALVERKSWLAASIFAGVFSFGTYGLFHSVLHVQLPRGTLGF